MLRMLNIQLAPNKMGQIVFFFCSKSEYIPFQQHLRPVGSVLRMLQCCQVPMWMTRADWWTVVLVCHSPADTPRWAPPPRRRCWPGWWRGRGEASPAQRPLRTPPQPPRRAPAVVSHSHFTLKNLKS